MKTIILIKSIILIIALLLIAIGAQAQEFKLKEAQSTQPTTETVTIAGKQFKGGYASTGTIYIWRTSESTGKEYKAYLGTRTDMDYKNHEVWTNKDKTKYWYYVIGESGYPKAIYLEMI